MLGLVLGVTVLVGVGDITGYPVPQEPKSSTTTPFGTKNEFLQAQVVNVEPISIVLFVGIPSQLT